MATALQSEDQKLAKLIRYCFIFSLVWHIVAAWFSIGYHLHDEYFSIQEFAGWKLGMSPVQDLPWEFPARIRPAIQPYAVVLVMKCMGQYANPVICAFLLRLFSAFLGLASSFLMLGIGLKWVQGYSSKRFLILATTLLWFFTYLHARFSAEGISGSLFFLGLGCTWYAKERKNNYLLYLSGLLLGLAFVCRYQTAFMIAGLLVWCIFFARFSFVQLLRMGLAACVIVAIGIWLDKQFYGEWVSTAYNYYKVNVIEGVAAKRFGASPWWSYFLWALTDLIPPFSLFCVAGILYAFYKFPKNPVVLAFIPFVLVHFFLSHKESRFLYPLVNGLPIVLALSYNSIYDRWIKGRKIWAVSLNVYFVLNALILVGSSLKPASDQFSFFTYMYNHYNGKSATLLCFEPHNENPYNVVGLNINFFRPHDLQLVYSVTDTMADSVLAHKHGPVLTVFYNRKNEGSFLAKHPGARFVYSNIPDWLYHFNFNDWISRTRPYRLYEIKG